MSSASSKLCPSHRCKPGSQVLGVRQDDGTVAILPQPLPVTEGFIKAVKQHELPPEQRFRFTNKCIEGGCNQWTGGGCGVVERVVNFLDKVQPLSNLPTCAIRNTCRWFSQRGGDACAICSYVITEITEEQVADANATEVAVAVAEY